MVAGKLRMRTDHVLIGIDDTDRPGYSPGTGKLARLLAADLCRRHAGLRSVGVLRHQLLVHPDIPYTSHNSPACLILETEAQAPTAPTLLDACRLFVGARAAPESAPGLCLARSGQVSSAVVRFGMATAARVVSQETAVACAAAAGLELVPVFGSGLGMIGALAAVGLTQFGDAGRYLELGGALRELPDPVEVTALQALGIRVHDAGRAAGPVPPEAQITTHGWLRPRRVGHRPVLPVVWRQESWCCLDRNANKKEEGQW